MQSLAQRFLALNVAVRGQKIAAVHDILYVLSPFRKVDNALVNALSAEIIGIVAAFLFAAFSVIGLFGKLAYLSRHKVAALGAAFDIALNAKLIVSSRNGRFRYAAIIAQASDRGQLVAFFKAAVLDRLPYRQIYLLIHRLFQFFVRNNKIV